MMSRITRLLLCALALGLFPAATLLPASAATTKPHPLIGVGDDKTDMFSDPRFLALGITTVRFDMHWDALSVRWERKLVTTWMNDAHRHHLDVLLTIDHTDKVIWKKVHVKIKKHGHWVWVWKKKAFSQTRVLPSPGTYLAAFRAFRARFPWVKNFVTWDETNYYGEATYDKEALIASYYRGMRHDCPSCKILAAEFLDVPTSEAVPMTTWAKAFVKALGYEPAYWGLNDYVDANNLQDSRTRALLRAVTGNVWLAETGGLVNRNNHSKVNFPQNAAHAAKVDRYLLDRIAALSPRIQRIYFYEWDARTRHDSWDSALISYTGKPRAGYDVVADALYSWGIKPNCAISRVPPACALLPPAGATGASGPTGASGATGPTH
jgi:hypothetical protein